MGTIEQFVHVIEKCGHRLGSRQITQFERYRGEIRRVNSQFGLISRNDLDRIPMRHFLDSLMPVLKGVLPAGGTIVDIGSGGGLPGIPLAIMLPNTNFVLVESNQKKSTFLRQVRRVLSLNNVKICHARIENSSKSFSDVLHDCAVARAVGCVEQLVTWSGSLLKPGGKLICYKGPAPEEEIALAVKSLEVHGMVWEETHAYEEGNGRSPTLVVLRKLGDFDAVGAGCCGSGIEQ